MHNINADWQATKARKPQTITTDYLSNLATLKPHAPVTLHYLTSHLLLGVLHALPSSLLLLLPPLLLLLFVGRACTPRRQHSPTRLLASCWLASQQLFNGTVLAFAPLAPVLDSSGVTPLSTLPTLPTLPALPTFAALAAMAITTTCLHLNTTAAEVLPPTPPTITPPLSNPLARRNGLPALRALARPKRRLDHSIPSRLRRRLQRLRRIVCALHFAGAAAARCLRFKLLLALLAERGDVAAAHGAAAARDFEWRCAAAAVTIMGTASIVMYSECAKEAGVGAAI